ncbi:HlyD family secretion protein [Cystobacter fuscus DSM 2262]|uniref:HlyD family secretion protein n=2 Tax=Cystobacter fuscus TaxID=43 RepID=S9PBD2_CYSF2|nr:HlyD family secretion protein [Cystobacter fuscus DSM 2262]
MQFSRTLRSIEKDGFRPYLLLLGLGGAMLLLWLGWFLLIPLVVLETSDQARVETTIHPVVTEIDGRIVRNELKLGREVKAGEVIAQLDCRVHELALEEERTRLVMVKAQLASLLSERTQTQQTVNKLRGVAQARVRETAAEEEAARTAAVFAERLSAGVKELHEGGYVSAEELERTRTEALQLRSTALASTQRLLRTREEGGEKLAREFARIERLNKEIAESEGAIETHKQIIERLNEKIAKCSIRAPGNGTISDVVVPDSGAYLFAGTRVAAVVGQGAFKIVAHFPPSSVVGRIKPGQPAVMRLQSFPWVEYGTLSAHVSGAASEIREEQLRVEFVLDERSPTRIPLQHGLLGSIEVEVERITPAQLVFRSVGKWWSSQGAAKGVPSS